MPTSIFKKNLSSFQESQLFQKTFLSTNLILNICLVLSIITSSSCLIAAAVTASMPLAIVTGVTVLISGIAIGIKCLSIKQKNQQSISRPRISPDTFLKKPISMASLNTMDSNHPFDDPLPLPSSNIVTLTSPGLSSTSSIHSHESSFSFTSSDINFHTNNTLRRKPFNPLSINYKQLSNSLPQANNNTSPTTEALWNQFIYEYCLEEYSNNSVTLIHKINGVRLTLTNQNIAIPFVSNTIFTAIVNSANETLSKEGNNTNNILAKATSNKCWEASKEGKCFLKIGEAVGGLWESSESFPSDGPVPYALIHVIGSSPTNTPSNKLPAQMQTTKAAYHAAFQKAASLNCSHIQVPLLSTLIFDPSTQLSPDDYRNGSLLMILELIEEFSHDSIISHVTFTDTHMSQWNTFCKEYSPLIIPNQDTLDNNL
ncbi:hypothetical protein CLAVI_000199 [Candidatus Clavichlamydia salmonicola]|uniref:hypothetical protein n=1 Tax=Candidatus Clavichlamydia salmonicola TaxID=469812 RepID=UPI00189195A9|nr:hypothetical protein [Candidatus Clavichlamydia salmonicola]MBF5050588.1 hypothetical protein [Candidatus Clavichlamydia salmonicola]